MEKTYTMSYDTRRAADNVEALVMLLDISITSYKALLRLIAQYGNWREKDGIAHGKLVALEEKREAYLVTASYYEQRNKELMSDILAVISEHRRTEQDMDDVPF